MPASRIRFRIAVFCVLCLASSVAVWPQNSRFTEDKAIDVEIKIVPFYAVDAEGRPVHDLKPEEVEVRVGGVPVQVQTFDRYATAAGASQPRDAAQASPTSRQVFFLFDLGFSSVTGLNISQKLASDLVSSWPDADRLHLIVNTSGAGLENRLGPIDASPEGKRKLLAEIKALTPEVRRLNLGLDNDFGPSAGSIKGGDKDSRPQDQMGHNYDTLRGSARGEYHGVARDFAEGLEGLAADLRRRSGPKLLLIFSQGMDPALYFEGDTGNAMGSDETIRVTMRRAAALVDRFKGPLEALADSGAMTLFVNSTQASGVDNVLRHMAQTSGGLYLDGVDHKGLKRRIADSTAAYYEAGFQPDRPLMEMARAGVEVAVRRPGVRAWAPSAVRTRETYRGLSSQEKKLMVVDLVSGGPEAQRSRGAVRLDVRDLAGRPLSGGDAAKRLLRFDIDWPAELASRKLDLYTVVLAKSDKDKPARIVQFDQQEGVETSAFGALETAFEGEDDCLWGIVAVDPETDRAWFRRLRIQPKSARK